MFPIQDQISVATKANLDANLALYATLASKTFENMEKLISLNINAVKASMEETATATRQVLAAKDPQEFFALVSSQSKPNFEKAISYGSHLANIAGSTQSEFTKAAESQLAQLSRKAAELMEDATRKAPAGSEGLAALMKTALGNATATYEQMTRTAKQAADAIGANITTTAGQSTAVVPAKN